MRLTVLERLQFAVLFPAKSDYVTLTLKQDALDKIRLSQEEIAAIGLKTDDGQNYSWDASKDEGKDIIFTDAELALIRQKLKDLDAKRELDDVTFAFYRKFVA